MRRPPNESLEDRHSPERTCILTRRTAGRDALIRLALGPNGEVARNSKKAKVEPTKCDFVNGVAAGLAAVCVRNETRSDRLILTVGEFE